jgi:hypothetical protein
MRLFEVDDGGAREVLAVLQGLANRPGKEQSSKLPWAAVQNILNQFALGISTPDGLIALKNKEDPQGDVIKDINTETGEITLNTNVKDPNATPDVPQGVQGGGGGPGIKSMASHNAKSVTK